jgi:hypothetical protein
VSLKAAAELSTGKPDLTTYGRPGSNFALAFGLALILPVVPAMRLPSGIPAMGRLAVTRQGCQAHLGPEAAMRWLLASPGSVPYAVVP